MKDAAEILYPSARGKSTSKAQGTQEEAKAPAARVRSNEEAGRILYPTTAGGPHPRYATAVDRDLGDDPSARDEALIRDRAGQILHRAPYYSNPADQVAANSDGLANADLTEVNLAGRELKGIRAPGAALGDIEGARLDGGDLRGALLRGSARGACFRMADLRGLELGRDVDITGADFESCKLDRATYDRLRACDGANAAKNLRAPVSDR